MIAPLRRPSSHRPVPAWHELFMEMVPAIQKRAAAAFRYLDPESRQEAVAEVLANCAVAVARLAELGKLQIVYRTPLANFAIRQVRSGRRVGAKLNVHDLTSVHAKNMKQLVVERLDYFVEVDWVWKEILIEDRNATPAELAASRIDFPAWLDSLSRRDRKLALRLASGESTGRVAKMFRVSAGRISQLRRELMASWLNFVGQPLPSVT